jgi:neutral ceramidase
VLIAAVLLSLFTALVGVADEVSAAPELRAGASTVAVPLPAGVPLAGYGSLGRRRLVPDLLGRSAHTFWLKPSQGTRDPILARALVIETPARRLLWVAVDLVAADAALVGDLAERLRATGYAYSAVIVSASHTHSGPGAFVDSALFGFLVMDRFDASVQQAVLDGIVQAAIGAERGKEPAWMGTSRASAPPMTRSRLDRPLDSEIALVKLVRENGSPIAVLWNFAIHPTVLGPRNLQLSGDVTGVASAAIERVLGVPALFINGAVADVSPAGHGEAAVGDLGRRLADAVSAAATSATPREGSPLAVVSGAVELGAPFLSLSNCLGGWLPRFLRVPLGTALPSSATLVAAALGDTAWVVVPGELQTALGTMVKEAGRRHFTLPFIAGLSNGYLGYFLTPEDYRRAGYVGCASLFGDQAGKRIASEAIALLEQLGAQRSRSSRAARDARRSRRRCFEGRLTSAIPARKPGSSHEAGPGGDLRQEPLHRGQAAGQGGFLAGGGVAVEDTSGNSAVQLTNGLGDRLPGARLLAGDRGARRLHRCPHFGPECPVPLPSRLALAHVLDRRLRVRHSQVLPGSGVDRLSMMQELGHGCKF